MSDIERILVAVDFSATSQQAIRYALLLGPSATLTLLHVYEPPSAIEGIVPGADYALDSENERRALRAEMDSLVAPLASKQSSRIQIMLDEGPIVDAILKRAITGNCELIVMGTHGKTALKQLLMGSVAEGVVRRAKCPVITVHLP